MIPLPLHMTQDGLEAIGQPPMKRFRFRWSDGSTVECGGHSMDDAHAELVGYGASLRLEHGEEILDTRVPIPPPWPYRWTRMLRRSGGYMYVCSPELNRQSAVVARSYNGRWAFKVGRLTPIPIHRTARAARVAAERHISQLYTSLL